MSEKILKILLEIKPYEQITPNTELIKSGILDSLSILTLVTQLEDEFEIEIDDEAVTSNNFATAKDIVCLVEQSHKIESGE